MGKRLKGTRIESVKLPVKWVYSDYVPNAVIDTMGLDILTKTERRFVPQPQSMTISDSLHKPKEIKWWKMEPVYSKWMECRFILDPGTGNESE